MKVVLLITPDCGLQPHLQVLPNAAIKARAKDACILSRAEAVKSRVCGLPPNPPPQAGDFGRYAPRVAGG